ncbi:MAG: hypothetical protein IKP95_06215 [Ruminococcus sp.]|nr:hypothetical protein [Ruminococcus sp.]
MSEIIQEEAPKKRKIPVKALAVLAAVLIFGIGLAVEIYKHSDSRMKSLLEDNRKSFEACGEYFTRITSEELSAKGIKLGDKGGSGTDGKVSGYASTQTLADQLEGESIAGDIRALDKAGVQKITQSGAEIRFYTDINSGICYIPKAALDDPEVYYPEGYLDDNRIDGDFYRFGKDVKKQIKQK